MDKQTAKLIARIAENLPYMDKSVMQGWINGPKKLQVFLAGLSPVELDFLVSVDRSVKPTYPTWWFLGGLKNPELECVGPAKYDLRRLKRHTCPRPEQGMLLGQGVYDYLVRADVLPACLNLQDGFAIQKKGPAVFRSLFKGRSLDLWGSVWVDNAGKLFVPALYDAGGKIGLGRKPLERGYKKRSIILSFRGTAS